MGLDTDLLSDGYSGNLTVLRALQLRCRMTDQQAAAFCLVSPHTYKRWGKDRDPNPTAVRLMAIKAGYVPWSGWKDWEGPHRPAVRAWFQSQWPVSQRHQRRYFRPMASRHKGLPAKAANTGAPAIRYQ